MKPHKDSADKGAGSGCMARLVRLSSSGISALRVVPQRLSPSVGGGFALLLLLFRQPKRLFKKIEDTALVRLDLLVVRLKRGEGRKNSVDDLAVLYLRFCVYCRAARFWWYWLRLVHKYGLRKAVIDARCRFWGFKFLPNAEVSHRDRERQPAANPPSEQP
jgi:hypothetical protein